MAGMVHRFEKKMTGRALDRLTRMALSNISVLRVPHFRGLFGSREILWLWAAMNVVSRRSTAPYKNKITKSPNVTWLVMISSISGSCIAREFGAFFRKFRRDGFVQTGFIWTGIWLKSRPRHQSRRFCWRKSCLLLLGLLRTLQLMNEWRTPTAYNNLLRKSPQMLGFAASETTPFLKHY